MNITSEIYELYATAKTAGKLDLAFRILACLAKMKPEAVSVEALSSEELTSIITECEVLTPKTIKAAPDSQPSRNDRKFLTRARTQAKAQKDPPP